MSDFSAYMLAQSRRETAYAQYNHASVALELAQIHERLNEVKSQAEPLASLEQQAMNPRERLHAAAFYVVVGRLPNVSAVHLTPNTPPKTQYCPRCHRMLTKEDMTHGPDYHCTTCDLEERNPNVK